MGYTPPRSASAASVAPVVTWSINAVNAWALVISGRRLVVEAPQVVHRHRVVPALVVPLRFMVAPQWQRSRFLGMGPRHHCPKPQVGCNTVYFRSKRQIYARRAYTFRVFPDQRSEITGLGHTFCRINPTTHMQAQAPAEPSSRQLYGNKNSQGLNDTSVSARRRRFRRRK